MSEKEANITIIKIEPHKEPEVITIPNTLQSFKGLVGGYIEGLGISPTAHMFVNEEGKLEGLEPNRRFNNDILVGTILIVGVDGEDTTSLTPEQIEEYMERFKTPEDISPDEVFAASGFDWFNFIF